MREGCRFGDQSVKSAVASYCGGWGPKNMGSKILRGTKNISFEKIVFHLRYIKKRSFYLFLGKFFSDNRSELSMVLQKPYFGGHFVNLSLLWGGCVTKKYFSQSLDTTHLSNILFIYVHIKN